MTVLLEKRTVYAPAEHRDRDEGLTFLNDHYFKVFGVYPSPPDHLCMVRERGTVVGTLGINVPHQDSPLRLARLYQLDSGNPDIPELSTCVEFGKWTCTQPGVTPDLAHAALKLILRFGMKTVLCEHTKAVNRTCRRLGIVFRKITTARLDYSMIEAYHKAFYDSNDAELYAFDAAQAFSAIDSYRKMH